MALPVPDGGRAGQVAGLAPGGKPLVLSGEAASLRYQSNGGCDSRWNRDGVFMGHLPYTSYRHQMVLKLEKLLTAYFAAALSASFIAAEKRTLAF